MKNWWMRHPRCTMAWVHMTMGLCFAPDVLRLWGEEVARNARNFWRNFHPRQDIIDTWQHYRRASQDIRLSLRDIP